MDGFGHNPSDYGNAIVAAKKPNLDMLMEKYPFTYIGASGMDVGLPDGQMGNSEVGHTNMGAGRVVYQELTRITKSIQDGDFFENEALVGAIKKSIENGIGLLTENRRVEGLILPMSVRENVDVVAIRKVLKNGLISRSKEIDNSKKYIDALSIKTPSIEQKVMFLSGGNQQKIVLSKWLMSDCEVIIMDEPTRGIDVGAKKEIYDIINDLAYQGKGVIVVSSESEEVMGISDRIVVMCEGKITGILNKDEFSQEKITALSINEGVSRESVS